VLLCIDVGNTQTALALYPQGPDDDPGPAGGRPAARWTARVRTERRATADELALTVRGMLGPLLGEVDGVAALSTVPALLRELRGMLDKHFAGVGHVLVEPGVRTGVPLLVDNPKEVGADRVVQALAAHEQVGGPCVVVVFGTSTTVDAVSASGEFLGGAIAAGVAISAEALAARAAGLRPVELVAPRSALGRSTVESMQAGLVLGAAAMVDGLVTRLSAGRGRARAGRGGRVRGPRAGRGARVHDRHPPRPRSRAPGPAVGVPAGAGGGAGAGGAPPGAQALVSRKCCYGDMSVLRTS
jgi:type III pantothenate kinase